MPEPHGAVRAVLLATTSVVVLAAAACSVDGPSETTPAAAPTTQGPTGTPSGAATLSPATDTPADPPPPQVPTPAASDRCHTDELSLVLGAVAGGAGQRQASLVLQSDGDRQCSITGFGGLALLDAAGDPLPVTLTRVGPTPTAVTFGPRSDQVSKVISWTVVSGDSGCVEPASVLVTPPDETASLEAPWTYGPVCGGRIEGRAFGAG